MTRILVILLAAVLAGCSDAPAAEPEDPNVPTADDVAKGKGIIRGVVIDPSIVPVEGALVQVKDSTLSTATDSNGGFLFKDVEPGAYFLTIAKPGWTTVQHSVQVEADILSPPLVRVQLEQMPGTEPRAQTVMLEGYISCSVGLPVVYTSCATVEEETNTLLFYFDGAPTWIQTETVWTSTQPSGDNLYLIQAICPDDDCPGPEGDSISGFPDRFDEGTRTSPAVARAAPEFIAGRELPSGSGVLAVDASADGPALATGVALSQSFTAYATFFYNIEQPDEDWRFIEDGPYVA